MKSKRTVGQPAGNHFRVFQLGQSLVHCFLLWDRAGSFVRLLGFCFFILTSLQLGVSETLQNVFVSKKILAVHQKTLLMWSVVEPSLSLDALFGPALTIVFALYHNPKFCFSNNSTLSEKHKGGVEGDRVVTALAQWAGR